MFRIFLKVIRVISWNMIVELPAALISVRPFLTVILMNPLPRGGRHGGGDKQFINILFWRKPMKKLLFILTLILSFNALAETKTYQCGENCTATLDESGVLRVSGTGEMYDYDDQTRFETPWYNDVSEIKDIVIENGITRIGTHSFFGFYLAENIEISDTVQKVSYGALDEARNLKKITVSDTTLWDNQDDIYNSENITLYCRGNLEKCKQNFLKYTYKVNDIAVAAGPRKNKRIYTIDEANRVAKPTGNTIRIKYR